jgi:hypothetical protein
LANAYYRLLQRLWRKGPGPAKLVFQELDFSRTVGARVVDQMAGEGVVGPDPETGDLKIFDSYGSVLGLHMGTRTVNAVVVNFTGELMLSKDFPYPDGGKGLVQAIQGVVAQMEPFLRSATVPPLRGVAVSLPGIVDPYRLILRESNPLRVFEPIALKEALGRPLGRPITVENDANCCCWGEAVVHRRQNLGNFMSILAEQRPISVGNREPGGLNLGVGFGLYLNGSVYHGQRFSAGEFKSVFKSDPREVNQFSLPDKLIARSYEDPEVGEAIARELSRNASLLVNLLDLDRVFVSWPRHDQAPRIVEFMREEIQRNWSYDHPVDCPVELPTMGYLAPAYGAAGLHLESLYQTADGPAPYFPGKN